MTQTVTLTRLESVALQCAARAVIDSAPVGSPGEPLIAALRKLAAENGHDDPLRQIADWAAPQGHRARSVADYERVLARIRELALSPTEGGGNADR